MHLVVIAVLSIVLAFPRPIYPWVRDPAWVVAAVAAATLLPALFAALLARRVLRLLDTRPMEPGRGQFSFGRGMAITHGLLTLLHCGVLLTTYWQVLCRRTPVVGDWPLVAGLMVFVPFLISVVLVWIATYPADRAVRQIALEVYLFRGRPVRPVWPLAEYLMFNLRHQVLFILIPMLLILAARDVIERYDRNLMALTRNRYLPDLLLGAAAALVAVLAPVIVRHVWVTQRLPDGPLRDRLLVLCRKLRVRCREILVWRSGGMIINAAVMGLLAPLRYVMITDAMLEQMDDTRIEAVFGHEAGHVRRHHILYYLLYALISGCLITVFSVRTRGLDATTYQLAATVGGFLVLLKWWVLFGWISRRFERQADVFGVRTLALAGLPCAAPCALHNPDVDSDPVPRAGGRDATAVLEGSQLCSTAAHVFGDTLNEVAVLNGIAPDGRSWRHGSISSRSRAVQYLARYPEQTLRLERGVRRVKWGILAAALASTLWAAWELRVWTLLDPWLRS